VPTWATLVSGVFLGLSSRAPAADLCAGLITDKLPHPMTFVAKPAVGQAITDPQFGTKIRRITAVPVSGSNPVIKPMYTTISAWNADESKLILYRVGSGHQLYDGRTYAFIRTLAINPADLEQVYWHTTDPDLLFYVAGNQLIRYHVAADVKEVVRTFTFCSSASGGSDPMFTSWDSNRIGLQCNGQVFIYDIAGNAVLGLRSSTSQAPQVAPSGTLAFWNGGVVDAQLNSLRKLDLGNPFEHASLGRLANGNDTYNGLAYDPGPGGSGEGSLVTHDMTTGVARVIVGPSTGYPYPPSTSHVSALAYKQPGWVELSEGGFSGQAVLDNEILLADTNTGAVCRVAHHRSFGQDNTTLGSAYWAEAHGVPSPSGTRILFGSDWGNGPSVDTYVVELPSYGNPPPSGPDLSMSLAATPNPALINNDVTYTAEVTNAGSAGATGVTATVTLASGLGLVSVGPNPSACTVSGAVVTCALGSLGVGAKAAITVVATASLGGTYTSQARAAGSPTDTNPGNDSATTSTLFAPAAVIGDASMPEGNSGEANLAFPITLSGPSRDPITIAYSTANLTATAGSDYRAVSGTLTVPAGATSGSIGVAVLGDTTVEPDEAFYVNLGAATGAVVTDGQGKGTIVNDDTGTTLPSVSVNDVTILEPRSRFGTASFTITLSRSSTQAVTVSYATSDGTATAGQDYKAASGSVTIPAGATTATVGVTVYRSKVLEPIETFSLNLLSVVGATIGDGTGVCTIVPSNHGTQAPDVSTTGIETAAVSNPDTARPATAKRGAATRVTGTRRRSEVPRRR
jgi:uncharacterized repeat protein (TIGR01451 family)